MEQRLKAAFKGFADFEGCIENVNHHSFKVFDFKDEYCRIVRSGELKDKQGEETLDVLNPDNKTIYCLSTDKCLLNKVKSKKCDCVLFDDKTIIFVEMKTDTLSSSNPKTIKCRCEEAIIQILQVQNIFIEKGVTFDGYRKLGIICFKKSTLTGAIRIQNPTIKGIPVKFEKEYKFKLNITNRVEFR